MLENVNVIELAAVVTALGGASAVVWRATRPLVKLVQTVDEHAKCLRRDKEAIEELRRCNRAFARAHRALLANAREGNNTGLIRQAEQELLDFLTDI